MKFHNSNYIIEMELIYYIVIPPSSEYYNIFQKDSDYCFKFSFKTPENIKCECIVKFKKDLPTNPLDKTFVQDKTITEYKLNGLYESLIKNLPLAWLEFIIKNEYEILFLSEKLKNYANKSLIYPKPENVFNLLHLIKPKEIKVVIIGQDPYPQKEVADGIAFSTKQNFVPPSLKNIYSELKKEGFSPDEKSDLTKWVKQGVFLMNLNWTVEENKPNSHSDIWDFFSLNIVDYIYEKRQKINKSIVIVCLGSKSKNVFKNNYNSNNVIFLYTSHPSPLACNYGFLGSNIFKNINKALEQQKETIINW